MAQETSSKSDGLGIWIRFWDLALAFELLVAAFLMVRLEAVVELRRLAVEKAFFATKPLLLDTYRHGYAYDTVRDHLRALGEDGRNYYANSVIPIYDLALSLFLLTFLVLFILYATQSGKYHAIGLPSWVRKLLLLPPILQFLFDVGENVMLQGLIDAFPRIETPLVEQASMFTRLKWLAIYANTMIVLGLGGFTLYQWLAAPAEASQPG